jgi:putative mRNA 3-end processing factor
VTDLVKVTSCGLYCPQGNFYIDPWKPVECAVVTHAHGDHLRGGSAQYHVAAVGERIARHRLPAEASLTAHPYEEEFVLGETSIRFYPAGHILGSSQIRIEHRNRVWVVSGDYKRAPDPTCDAFKPIACDVFISEATFGLPIYRWDAPVQIAGEIFDWWQLNRSEGAATVLFVYALGKAQRVLAELRAFTAEPVYVHGSVATLTELYREQDVAMLPTLPATVERAKDYAGALILAPPSAAGSPWARRFGDYRSGFCSGWMRVRGDRRRRGYDRGFVLSDHADWPALLQTFSDTGARRILLTHGRTDTLSRYLREQGIDGSALQTQFGAEE